MGTEELPWGWMAHHLPTLASYQNSCQIQLHVATRVISLKYPSCHLPCFKVLARLSRDLKVKPNVLPMTYKVLYDLVMARPAPALPKPWPDGTH